MNHSEFQQQVRLVSSPIDFSENEHLLEVVQPAHYLDFLNCLITGIRIKQAFKGLDMILYISGKLKIGTVDVIKMIPEFRDNMMLDKLCLETAP